MTVERSLWRRAVVASAMVALLGVAVSGAVAGESSEGAGAPGGANPPSAAPPPAAAPGVGAPPAAAAPEPPLIKDERAITLLKKMCDTVAQAKSLTFKTLSMVPFDGPNHQWLTLIGTARVALQRPNKLFVARGGDQFPEDFFFDGDLLTVYAPGAKLYAQEQAGKTIDEMIIAAFKKGANTFTFAEILVSDPCTPLLADVTGALFVGVSTIDGVPTQHLAFTAKDSSWEIWIGAQDALPRGVRAIYHDLPGSPTLTIQFSDWKLNPKIPASTFVFKAPAGVQRTEMRDPSIGPATAQ